VLDPDQKAVEEKFYNEVQAKLSEYVERYCHEFSVISTDNAREFCEDYNRSNEARARYAAAIQEPATLIVREVWLRSLSEPPAEGQLDAVVFLVGGGGSGKTTSLENVPGMKAFSDQAQIVYETIFSDFESSAKKIEQALNAGKNVAVVYVHRPIDEAAVGVLRRAIELGRTYPIGALSEGHFQSQRTVLQLASRYENNPSVSFFVIDNSRGLGKAALADLDFLQQNLYNSIEDVEQRAREAINNDYKLQAEQGRPVPEYVYRGIVGGRGIQQEQKLEGIVTGLGEPTGGESEPQRNFAGERSTERSSEVDADNGQDATLLNSPENQRQALSILQVAKRLLNTYGGSGSEREFNMRKSGYAIRQVDSTFTVLDPQGKEIVSERDGQITFDIEAPDIKVFKSAEKQLNKEERDRNIDGR
jgi:hypothetical protein